MSDSGIPIFVHEGNTIALPFQLYVKGSTTPWDVDSATSITLDAESEGNAFVVPADSVHPDANWTAGRVVVQIGPGNITGALGTYRCVLTVSINTEVISIPHSNVFLIEVVDRPAYP
jgi:hypothetical protein